MIWKRLLMVVPLLIVVSIGVFALELMLPGDAAVTLAGPQASTTRIAEIRHNLHLDQPVATRYLTWAGHAVRGDFGDSLYTRRPVRREIASRWVVTFSLVAGAVLLSLAVSIPLALLTGRREGGRLDRLLSVGSSLGVAVPDFVVGIVLIIVFAIWLRWLPIAGWMSPSTSLTGWFRHLLLPVIALSAPMTAILTRQLRSDLAETLGEDYLRTAYAKGLPERTILVKHALRAAAPPTVSILGVQVARLLGGVVVVETVFGIPGLGQLTIDSILNKDLPVIQGVVPVMVVVAVVANLLADLLNLVLNPKLASVG